MAARVEDILVRLKLEGLEGLDRIRSSFRELGKVTQMSERDILTARTRLLEFATAAGNTEAVIAGLTPALKGLRAQVDICGDAYAELSRDIEQVSNISRGYTDQAAAQRNALNAQTTAITNNVEALRRQRAALIDLQSTTRTGSQLYTQLGADIQRTAARLDEMDAVVRRTDAAAGRGLPSSAAKIRRDLADVRERIALERAAIDDLNLLTKRQRKDFKQGELAGESGVARAIAARQAALSGQLVRQNMLNLSENVRTQREAVRTANAMYSTPIAVTGTLSPEGLTRSFGELPNTIAGLNQQVSELRDRLNNTTLGTRAYVDAALLMASTQRQLREATMGVAASLVEQLRAGNITPSMANLREVLASVRGEQSLLNTNTAEGARAFQLAEMRARALERQLAALQTTQASLSRTPVSGFGAWSAGIRERVLQGTRTQRRLEQAQSESLQRTGTLRPEQQQLLDAANAANANYVTAYRQHQRTLTDAQQQGFNDRLAAQQAAADAELRLQRQANDAALADFQRRLTQETAVLQKQRAMQRQLGFLGGQNLSSTYQQIVGLSSASAQVSEERMGRSATQVFNDTLASFQAGIAGAAAASVTAPSAVSASRNAGTNLAQGVVQQLDNSLPDVVASATRLGDGFIQGIKSKTAVASQAVQQLVGGGQQIRNVVEGVSSVAPTVAAAADKFASAFVLGIRKKAGAAADAAKQLVVDASTALAGTVVGATPSISMSLRPLSERARMRMEDPWEGPTGDYRRFINSIVSATKQLQPQALLPAIAASRDLWAGPIGDYNNFISRIITATERVRPQALLAYRAESRDPWSGVIGDYKRFIASIASTTAELRSPPLLTGTAVRALLPARAESRDLWAGPIGDYRNFIASISTASAELRSQALLTGTSVRGLISSMAQIRDPWAGAYSNYRQFIASVSSASSELRGQALLTGTSIRGLLLPDITTVDPWALPLSQYKSFIDSIVLVTSQLRTQLLLAPAVTQPVRALLTGTAIRALLPESAASLVPGRIDAQMSRLDQALERSRIRSEAVFAEDTLARRKLLPPGRGSATVGAEAGTNVATAAAVSSAAWQRYNTELGKFGAVSRASIDQLNALKASLDRQRTSLSPLEADYARVNRAIEQQSRLIDRELARRDRAQRPRLSGMQLAQGFGAALTGGIFGGPEGLIGGLGGLAVGGVGGAFAGAAFGAQAGMFRQQLAGLTDYSARIDKMQIALRGVVKDQASYNAVLDAQAAITRDLNIPQETAIRGLTRLSAAVLGAGGTVNDSTFAYRAMTEAIKATGGSAEQVDGALLALTQVFSKGKVSAEELNQIAERLPGTFTLFAKAAGKTGPELQKALQQGQVGISDLTKFLELLSAQYGSAALGVSRSTQEAGARLTVTMQAMQRDVGRALQPVGAAFQTAFAAFITDVGPSLVATLKSIAPALQSMASLVPYMGELAKALLSLGAVVGLTAAFVKLGGAMVFLAGAIKSVGGIAAFATLQLQGLSGAITGATLINPWTAAAAGVAALTVAISKAVLEQKALTDETARYVEAASKQRAPEVATTISKLEDKLREARRVAAGFGPVAAPSVGDSTDAAARGAQVLLDIITGATTARSKVAELELRLRKLQGVYRARIELDAVFRGQRGVPEGYKVINGRLAYKIPGGGYVDAETGQPIAAARTPQQQQQQQAETKRAETLLDAIDKREEAIGQARIQLEEQAREIRKQAIEQAKQLEEQFASQRLNRERDIAALRRQAAGLEQDIAFSLEALRVSAAGGDPELIRIQQNAAQVARDINEERIRTEERIFDEQTSRAKAIKDLQLATAKAVNEGNARYAKAIGDAQLQYARTIAKLQDEASGRQASRLVVAQQLASMYQQRDHLQTMRVQAGEPLFDNPAQYRGNEPLYNTSTGVRSALPYNIEREIPPSFVSTDRRITVLIGQLNSLSRVSQTVAAPAIDRIAVNTDDLTASLNKATAALAELDAKFKELQATVGASQLQKAALEQAQALLQPVQAILQQRQQLVTDRQREEAIRKLRLSGKTEEQARQSLEAMDASALLGTRMSGLRTSFLGKANTEDERAKLTALFDEIDKITTTTLESITKTTSELLPETFGQQLTDAFIEARDQLNALVEPINMVKSAADSIGTSFGNAFKGIISGSMTAKEALAGFLQSVADSFLDMAAQIITQWIKMIILNNILNLFPQTQAAKPSAAVPSLPAPKLNALGNAYGANGIVPFAYGGVVDQPMLFPFAKGGAMQTGVLGEAGPEAIIPLKRGRDGRLGVSGGGNVTNVTVTVDASNTSAAGNNAQGQALGRAISRAVQSELVTQQRPGGLLDPNRSR